MSHSTRLKGRPALKTGKRSRKIDARFTEEEYQSVLALEKELGISKTELIRSRLLAGAPKIVINAKAMIADLDAVGTELGRSGNNINQLARYANILNKRGLLSGQVMERFNVLFESYLKTQQLLEITLRKVIREMGK